MAAPRQLQAQGPADKSRCTGHQDACQTAPSATMPQSARRRPGRQTDYASDFRANALERGRPRGKTAEIASIAMVAVSRVSLSDPILPIASSPAFVAGDGGRRPKLLFLATEDWYFWTDRLPVARAARDAGFAVIVAARVRAHAERIRAEGFALRPLAWRRRGDGLFGAARAVLAIARLYRAERPDIIHHVALKPMLFGGLARRLAFAHGSFARGAAAATVDSVMGLGSGFSATTLAGRLGRRPLGLALRLAAAGSRVVVQNPDDRVVLARLGLDPRRIALIRGSGVDTARFAALPAPPAPPVRVALVARMLRQKGVLDAVAAVRLLRARGLAVELLLAGGPDPDNPDSLARGTLDAFAGEPGIEWLGPVEDVRAVWRRAAICLLPSTYGEGLPRTLLEAASCARPMVATDIPGCREVVRPGDTGLLVPPHDVEALAAAIAELAQDPALRAAMGEAARAMIERQFAEAVIVCETLSLYRAALAERAAAERAGAQRARAQKAGGR
jgi:glycosyltransferase involved in cell wall biosynthesis